MSLLLRLKALILILFFILIFQNAKAQTIDWTDYVVLYQDNDIKVEVSFYLSKSACDPNSGKPIKYRYQVSGKLDSREKYLIWKVIYKNCSGSLNYEYVNLPIGGSPAEKLFISGLNVINDLSESLDNTTVTNSADYQILGSELKTQFTDVHVGKSQNLDKGRYRLKKSTEPNSIVGPAIAKYNTDIILTLDGGELGENSDWYWYKDNCAGNGTLLGTGPTLTLNKVSDEVKVFVRAEGNTGSTNCVSFDLKVNTKSSPPTGVSGPDRICAGESVKLSVQGGELGKDANWVWRLGNENGEVIGTGLDITVNPLTKSIYFVRAESAKEKSASWTKSIDVLGNSELPSKINVSYNSGKCEGAEVKLFVNDGKLGYQSSWTWYKGTCGKGSKLGVGESINVTPYNNENFYLISEGLCNSLNCVDFKFTDLSSNTLAPSGISTNPTTIIKRKRFRLDLIGGNLGTNANWYWYEGSQLIGTGKSITYKVKKSTTIQVFGSGDCNKSDVIYKYINPDKKTNINNNSKIFNDFGHLRTHLGVSFGTNFGEYIRSYNSNDSLYNISRDSAVGFNFTGCVNLNYHPVFKQHIQLGLFGEYNVGWKAIENADTNLNTYNFQSYAFGIELAAGFRPIKILARLNQMQASLDNINNYGQLQTELGFRIGSMKYKTYYRNGFKKFGKKYGDISNACGLYDIYLILNNTHLFNQDYSMNDFMISENSTLGFGINKWTFNNSQCFNGARITMSFLTKKIIIDNGNSSSLEPIKKDIYIINFGLLMGLDRFYSK